MAKEQWKKLGIYIGGTSLILGVLGSMIGLVAAGSSKFTAYDKDIQANELKAETAIQAVTTKVTGEIGVIAGNQAEDRTAIKDIAEIVAKLIEANDKDHKEFRRDDGEAKLRDARMATQYTAILNHMQQQTEHVKKADSAITKIQVDVGKIQTQVDTLIKD